MPGGLSHGGAGPRVWASWRRHGAFGVGWAEPGVMLWFFGPMAITDNRDTRVDDADGAVIGYGGYAGYHGYWLFFNIRGISTVPKGVDLTVFRHISK